MNTDFAKLLNNCLNRIDGKDDDTKTENVDSEAGKEIVGSSSSNSSSHEVRPEIKDIIDDVKTKATDDTAVSPTIGLVKPIKIRLKASNEDPHENEDTVPEKAKILFSLKDFFERSKDNELTEKHYAAPKEDKQSDNEDSDLDKNVDAFYKDGEKQPDDSGKESDDSESDLEVVKSENSEHSVEDFKSTLVSDDSDLEDTKEDPDQDSDLESELNVLEKLKQKLDDNIDISTKNNDKNDVETNKEETGDNVTSKNINENEVKENVKDDQEKSSANIKESKEFNAASDESDPIIIDDLRPKETNDRTSKLKEARSIFKNISISVVGGNSKNINLESFLNAKPPQVASKPTPIFPTGPNISIKRKSGSSPTNVFDSKRSKKSTILLSSDEERSPKKKSVPTVTLDEHSTLEDVSEDEEDTDSKDDLTQDDDNCTHGDPMDYMCVDCTYNRWRCQWEQARPKKVKVKTVADISNPVEIIQAVNWEKVFKFAGVNIGEEVK